MTIQLGIFAKPGQVVRDSNGRKVGRVFTNWGTEFVMWRGLFHLPMRVGHEEVSGIRGRNVYLDMHRRDLDGGKLSVLKEVAQEVFYRVRYLELPFRRSYRRRW